MPSVSCSPPRVPQLVMDHAWQDMVLVWVGEVSLFPFDKRWGEL